MYSAAKINVNFVQLCMKQIIPYVMYVVFSDLLSIIFIDFSGQSLQVGTCGSAGSVARMATSGSAGSVAKGSVGSVPRNQSAASLSSHESISRNESFKSQNRLPVGYSVVNNERQGNLDVSKGMPTPPGSLNRKRRNSTDSPRNPSRKSANTLSNCISGHISETESEITYARVDSPELPAVHFMNVKTQNAQPVHNAMFDSLKIGHSALHAQNHDANILSSPQSRLRQGNIYATPIFEDELEDTVETPLLGSPGGHLHQHNRWVDSRIPRNISDSNILPRDRHRPSQIPRSISSPGTYHGGMESSHYLQQEGKRCSHGQTRSSSSFSSPTSPASPRPYSPPVYASVIPKKKSPLPSGSASNNIPSTKPCQVVAPTVPMVYPTPLVMAGVAPPLQCPVRAAPGMQPQSVQSIQSSHFGYRPMRLSSQEAECYEEIPLENRFVINNMLQELGRVVNPLEPNRPQLKHAKKGKSSKRNENPRSPEREEKLVTGTYREPLSPQQAGAMSPHREPLSPQQAGAVSPHRSPISSPIKTPMFEHVDSFSGSDKSASSPPPPPIPPKPKSSRKSSESSRESRASSSSSQSTLTPTSALVASIDGRTMSILQGIGADPNTADHVGPNPIPLPIRRVPSDSVKDRTAEVKPSASVRRSNSSPRMKPSGVMSPSKSRHEYLAPLLQSDDDRESTCSKPMSEHSSVVLLQPIELKLAKSAYVKQLSCPSDDSYGHYTRAFLANTDFMIPHLDRNFSKSSDTIYSSVSHGPATPKFPLLSSATSSSLTQLLQELAAEHPRANLDTFTNAYSQASPCRERNDGNDHQFHGIERDSRRSFPAMGKPPTCNVGSPKLSHPGRRKPTRLPVPIKNRSPQHTPSETESQNTDMHNAYQGNRRGHFTVPPRQSRSLEHVPSDNEGYTSSAASSACGSPKNKRASMEPFYAGKIEQYLAGRNALGLESLSFSSIASSSEMSKSDPALNLDSGSTAYESEYDNYRPGMTSDDDFYGPGQVSDVDMELFDDINIDNVTVSDSFSLDMPVSRFQKKITDV